MGIIQDAVNSAIGATAKTTAVVKGVKAANELTQKQEANEEAQALKEAEQTQKEAEKEKTSLIKEGDNILKSAQDITKQKAQIKQEYGEWSNYNIDLVKSEQARKEITAKKNALRKQLKYINQRNKLVKERINSFNEKASNFGLKKIGG